MSEFLLELYSEEIPPNLQINARVSIKELLQKSLKEEGLKFKSCNTANNKCKKATQGYNCKMGANRVKHVKGKSKH